MYKPPENSLWGEVQHAHAIMDGIYEVDTAGHGGIMVRNDVAMSILSPAARKCGERHGGYYCYEEDCDYAVVLRELLDKQIWTPPARHGDPKAYETRLDESIQRWNPEYWEAREKKRSPTPRSGTPKQPHR